MKVTRKVQRDTGRRFRRSVAVVVILLSLSLQGCYYLQAANGQFELWRKQRPVDEVIADPRTPPDLAQRLRLLQAARDFATGELLLPDNGSYRAYADLGREFVLWNVIAAPEFSLQPRQWCYLVVGCLAYRGYFDRDKAHRFADGLRRDGLDVFVAGVPAYSTLGTFNDPLLNTMMNRGDAELISLLFHELAHQRLYVEDDTGFNESFASAVAEFGLQAWFARRGDTQPAERLRDYQQQSDAFMERIGETRDALQALYSSGLPRAAKRQQKKTLLAELASELQGAWQGDWTVASLNNARLATLTLYRGNLPAFRALFEQCSMDWSCFYSAVDRLATLSPAARVDAMAALERAAP